MTGATRALDIDALAARLRPRLARIYGARAEESLAALLEVCRQHAARQKCGEPTERTWSERDVVLISYPDQFHDGGSSLAALHRYCWETELSRYFNTLHLLPFFPSSSDDGFSVMDYRSVDPRFGGWEDIARLRQDFELMFDLVLNHASSRGEWFRRYREGVEPYDRFFVESTPEADLSQVARPRTTPLLTRVDTARGERWVWTTFSDDQIDLNFAEPSVLVEIVDILLEYVRRGASIVRLDAIAFLWKRPGTPCIHLDETHEVVRLMRDVVDAVAPGSWLLTETNVPQDQNVTYWGAGDEARLIYNFSLPPLLVDALLSDDATYLQQWLAALPVPPAGATWFNFTASHDGIGVRPLESLVPHDRIATLVAKVLERDGLVSQRAGPDGEPTPYELNITYADALSEPGDTEGALREARFLASQAFMLALRGIPAVYLPSLVGAGNDHQAVARTGRARSINRPKWKLADALAMPQENPSSRRIWEAYRRMLDVRRAQPAFHPDADQVALSVSDTSIAAWLRVAPASDPSVLVLNNIGRQPRHVDVAALGLRPLAGNLLVHGASVDSSARIAMGPYQVAWVPVHPAREPAQARGTQ